MRRANLARHTGGQALVLFAVFAAVLAIGVVLLFDTGQTVSKKNEMNNAARAAAYSLATQQAKALNFAAYMNRARIANEVTIAQAVSVSSFQSKMHTHWLLMEQVASIICDLNIPYLSAVFCGVEQVVNAQEIATGLARVTHNSWMMVAVPVLSTANTVYAQAADRMLTTAIQVDSHRLVENVLDENTNETAELEPIVGTIILGGQILNATTSSDDTGSSRLLVRHNNDQPNAGMDRFKDLIMASLDRFAKDRNHVIDMPWLILPGCPLPSLPGGDLGGGLICYDFKLRIEGQTEMIGYDRWVAADSQRLTYEAMTVKGKRDRKLRLGWGGAQAVWQGSPDFDQSWSRDNSNKRRWSDSCPAANCSNRTFGNSPSVGPDERDDAYTRGYQGLKSYYDVNSRYTHPDTGFKYTVFIATDPANANNLHRSSEHIDGIAAPEGGQIRLESGGGGITAIASGQAYFYRPPDRNRISLFRRLNGNDNELEYGSTFSPYWQARLVETPKADYLAAQAR